MPPSRRPVCVDGGRDAAPEHGVAEAGLLEDLGHLRDVAEHVGQVAELHDRTEGRAALDAQLEIPDDGLGRDQELVHQDVPGAQGEPTRGGQRAEPLLGLGTDLEVVVDHRHLAVEQ